MASNNSVLIIENRNSDDSISATTKRAGYLVSKTSDFETALRVINDRKPELLICGDAVNNSASIQICKQLRAELSAQMPVICLVGTEKKQSNQIHLILETGADKYIESPFEPLEFIRTVTTLIEGQVTKSSLEQKDVIFRSLIESITDIITVISPDGYVLYESPSVEHILGRKPVDSLGINAFEFIHQDDRQKVIDYVLNANRDDAAKGVEYRIRHNDGSWRIFHSVGRFNRSIFKTKTVLITSRDVTIRNLLAERHQLALEKARMVWWEWDTIRNKISTSDNFAQIYGMSGIDQADDGFRLLHPDDAARHQRLVESIANSGGSYHAEFRIIRQDNGEIIWLEETAAAFTNDQQQVERLVGISFDISERKKAESKLRESEEKFKGLYKGIPIPVYLWQKNEDEDGFTLIESNDAGDKQTTSFSSRHFGMKSSELLDGESEILDGLNRCLKERRTINFETKHHQPESGELKILDLSFVCISPRLVMVVSRDITQERFAETERSELLAQIEAQNRRLNDIIDSIPGALWETRVDGGITDQYTNFVSDYVEKLIGYSKEEWLAKPDFWLEIMHPDDRQQAIQKSRDFLEKSGEGLLEYRFIKKNGDVAWMETQIRAVRNEDGEMISLTGITIDIDERKKAEAALLASEEKLRQSQRLESVGRLAGGIAHDFNNMLTAINGYSELILRELKEESPIRAKVLEIKKAGERSALLTQQLLAFSRRQIMKPQRLDLNHIIADMNGLLSRLIGEHIELEINLSPAESCVEADPGQLSQVIMNLAVNARDAMPKGGKMVIKTANIVLDEDYAASHAPTLPGKYVLLSVADTGAGIDDVTKEHIFEPFYTTKEKGSGTGLGLATVYGVVKQSGGYIWVESEPDNGATFEIYLPQITDDRPITVAKTNITETKFSGTETILLVEDEQAVRRLTQKVLEMQGYKVIEARDGIEALEIFKGSPQKISLLITDVVMPHMSGRDLAEKIGEIAPDVRVLFSSGYSDNRNILQEIKHKNFGFLNKPFTSEEIGHKVRELLDK